MKKAIVLLLAAVLALSLMACGVGGNTTTTGTIGEQTTEPEGTNDVNDLFTNPFTYIPSSEWREYKNAAEKLNRPLEEIDAMYFYLEVMISVAQNLGYDYSPVEDMKASLKSGEKLVADTLEKDMKEKGKWDEYIADIRKVNTSASAVDPEVELAADFKLISSGKVQFDDGGELDIIVYMADGTVKGLGLLNFKGENPVAENDRIYAILLVFSELNIDNYSISGTIGDDYIILFYENGEFSRFSQVPEEILGLLQSGPPDTASILPIAADIAGSMKAVE